MSTRPNPLLGLPFEAALEDLGPEYWDVVEAATFPLTRLRFRHGQLQDLGTKGSGTTPWSRGGDHQPHPGADRNR